MSSTNVGRAISIALNQGYQVGPDAVKLLQQLAEKKKNQLESMVLLAIEDKAKKSSSEKTITSEDLARIFPDEFPEDNHPSVESQEKEFEVLKDPSYKIQPTGTEGFAQLFKSRYEKLSKIFMERPEGRQLVKISKINYEAKGSTRISGLVFGKRPTKNGVELTVDDDSGKASVLAINEDAKKLANQVSLDQCVMLEVEPRQGRLILKNIMQPDLPSRIASTSKKTVYAVFLSDLHIGSNKFLDGAFDRFLLWLQGKWKVPGQDDEELIKRLKYVIIGGDVVDGVGVFPNQEYELSESNIYKQYEMVSQKLRQFPEHLEVIIIPGNHDSTRQALPQPMIPRKYAESLYQLKNVTMLGDPCVVKLHGVSILMYHGRSLDDVLATTPGLSYEHPTEAMKVLLKARHLAPMFGSRTPIAPEIEDHLVIEQAPDIFHAGHVHSVGADTYKSTLIINSGTWQAQTGYQANLGIMPKPGLVPVVNLATLDVEFREFLTSS
ncbi:MAG: DNA-directed DNA polymerase II small subunit [Nitrososphaerales archaeon]